MGNRLLVISPERDYEYFKKFKPFDGKKIIFKNNRLSANEYTIG
jgi:hypothetical protein